MSRAARLYVVCSLFVFFAFIGFTVKGWAQADTTQTSLDKPAANDTVAVGASSWALQATVTDNNACTPGPCSYNQTASPTGTVTFMANTSNASTVCTNGTSTTLATVTVSTGTNNQHSTVFSTSIANPLAANTWFVQACFNGTNGKFDNSNSGTNQISVGAARTSTSLPASGSSTLGASTGTQITATVSDLDLTSNTLVGYVQFFDTNATLGTNVLIGKVNVGNFSNHQATAILTLSTLPTGSHSITATFISTNTTNFSNSPASAAMAFTITTRGTTTAVQKIPDTNLGSQAPVGVGVTDAGTNNPGAGKFAANSNDTTQNLITARSDHTSTALPDGTALIFGGLAPAILASPELYTPKTGFANCSTAACTALSTHYNTGLYAHTATLLADGTVMFAGGSKNGTTATNDVEIVDPVGGTIVKTLTLNSARMYHTATLLANGNVVIAGGLDGPSGNAVNTLEIYTGGSSFTTVSGTLATARAAYTATLLSTGTYAGSGDGAILFAGGVPSASGSLISSAEILVITGTAAAPPANPPSITMATARAYFTATRMPDGLILVAGGLANVGASNTAELFDPSTNKFVAIGGTAWAASNPYTYGTIITPVNGNNGSSFRATVAGTSGGSEPTWSTSAPNPGNTIADGATGLVWTNIGVLTLVHARQEQAAALITWTDGTNTYAQVLLTGGTASGSRLATAELYMPAYDPQGTITLVSDSGGSSTTDTVSAPCSVTLTGTGLTACTGTVTPHRIGNTNPHTVAATYVDATTPSINHSTSCDGQITENAPCASGTGQTLKVLPPPITLTAVTDTVKVYDATPNSALSLSVNSGTVGTDTAVQRFVTSLSVLTKDVPSVANSLTLKPFVLDSNGNDVTADYNCTCTDAANGTINPAPLTITAQTNTKNYNGDNLAAAVPVASGLQGSDTVSGLAETYDTKNVGTGKTLTVSAGYTINDGNSGNNYSPVNLVTNTSGVITAVPLTITSQANTKPYDSGVTATTAPIATGMQGSDTVTGLAETYDTKNVGTGKTLSVSAYTINDGNSGNNYNPVNLVTNTSGVITKAPLTITAITNNKTYDSQITAAAIPTVSGLQGTTDTVTGLAETYDTPNAGTGKTMSVSAYTVNDGNSGGNYAVTTVTDTTGVINPLGITATLTASDKTYDATPAATITTCTLNGVLASDVGKVGCTGSSATFASVNVGMWKVTATVTLSGTAPTPGNYSVTSPATTTASISKAPLTITAQSNTKSYDGGTSAATLPAVTGLQGSDTVTGLAETYDTRDIGTGKTLSVSAYTVNDGNTGGNYTVTTVTNTTGVINKATLTITAKTNTKTYDTTTTAAAVPTVTGLQGTDTVTGLKETYDNKNVGSGKTLTVIAYTVNDGNSGANYTVTTVPDTTGVITQAPLTVSATGIDKIYDGTTVATVTLSDNRFAGDVLTTSYTTATFADSRNVGTGKPVAVTGITIAGTDAPNYSFNTTAATTANVTQRHLALAAKSFTKIIGQLYTFAGTEFSICPDATNPGCTATDSLGLGSGDTLTNVTLTSSGAAANAPSGLYAIKIASPLSSTNIAPSSFPLGNYAITALVDGTMTVSTTTTAVTLSSTFVVTAITTDNPVGGTFTFNFKVSAAGVANPVLPTGSVTITDNGTAVGTVNLDAAATGTLPAIKLAPSATPHVIIATYNHDSNYESSAATLEITVTATQSFTAGSSSGGSASPAMTVVNTSSGTLSNSNIANSPNASGPNALTNPVGCHVWSVLLSATTPVDSVLTYCTATLSGSLAAGASGQLTINIVTTGATIHASLQQPTNHPGAALRALFAMSLAMPALAFIGMAAPFSIRKRELRRKVLAWVGLALVLSMLLFTAACGGGGFANPNNLGPVTVQKTQAGSYTAVVTYSDANNNPQVLASVPFTVQ